MNPLDALSALNQAQSPLGSSLGSMGSLPSSMMPNGATNQIGESFQNMLQPLEGMQGNQGTAITDSLQSLLAPLQNAQSSTTNPISEGFRQMLQPLPTSQASTPMASFGSSGGPNTWGHMVQQMVLDVNTKQETAAQKVSDVLQGGPTPVHEAMVATEEASLSFEFLGEMRNKIVESYQQIMQMQV